MADGRTRWSDDRLDDKFASLERRINSLPDRVTRMEGKLDETRDDGKETRAEVRQMHNEFRASKQGMTRGEKIALVGSLGGFTGALVAAVALLAGVGG